MLLTDAANYNPLSPHSNSTMDLPVITTTENMKENKRTKTKNGVESSTKEKVIEM